MPRSPLKPKAPPPRTAEPGRTAKPARDADLARALLVWFDAAARELPWRPPGRAGSRDPYHTLVSEFMLQQTQASRVAERFPSFLARFPSLTALAAADEHEVLAEWSGLGYYRRARLLQAAARAVAERHGARVPADPAALADLPGIGRYTAGAIASLSFNHAAPAVDGNVTRVMLRLEARPLALSTPRAVDFASARARSLLATPDAAAHAGALNESLIELGATICTPRAPRCARCPVATHCRALARGLQDRIPLPKPAPRQQELFADALLIHDAAGRVLVEQRPDRGLWARMWQIPTLESRDATARPAPGRLPAALGITGVRVHPAPMDQFTQATTHRLVRFCVWKGQARGPIAPITGQARAWKLPSEIASLALSNPQRRILLGGPAPPG